MDWVKIGQKIKQARKEKAMTLQELGRQVGKLKSDRKAVSHVTIRNWENGSEIKADNLQAVLKVLGIESELLNASPQNSNKSLTFNESNATYIHNPGKVPLIDMVAAGDWCEVADPYPIGEAESWEPCPVPHGENTFAVRINGESMAPKFQHGEIIFCDPSQQANNNDYVIAKLTDENQATFKQLIIDGGQYMLKAINPNWPNQYIPINGNCQIVGKVIARLEKF